VEGLKSRQEQCRFSILSRSAAESLRWMHPSPAWEGVLTAYYLLCEVTMANTKAVKSSPRKAAPNAALLERMLYYLKLTRESEWRIENVLYRQGKIVGGVYVGRGQEAIGVGAALAMRAGDVTFPSHRDFSVFVIRGFTL